MTLIYAHITEDIAFIVADTLLTSPALNNEKKSFEESHALKVHILNEQVAIAFSGDVDTSLYLIHQLHNDLIKIPKIGVAFRLWELYGQLIERSIGIPPDCDFLVLQVTNEGKKLTFITSEKYLDVNEAHIGDEDAYKRLRLLQQQYPYTPVGIQYIRQTDGSLHKAPLSVSKGEIAFEEISCAMEVLANEQPKHKSVGAIAGCVSRIVNAKHTGNLEYLQAAESSVSIEEGHSGYSILASNSGTRGIGIYYRSGKMGFLFIAGDLKRCQKEYAATIREFIDIAMTKYRLNLEGGMW